MTLLRGCDALVSARRSRQAIPGFSVYNLEQVRAVVQAAEACAAPVIVMAGASAFRYAGTDELMALAVAAARGSSAPVGVHLDHGTSLEQARTCLQAGYTSVMFDGSHLPYADNVHATREVAELAHRHGAWIEGELAGTAGAEDSSELVAAGPLTDPDLAARFVAETGIDALAVSVGNVHGMAAGPAALDHRRLGDVARRVSIPLVLHGASGLPDAQVSRAIRLGVAKLNVNAELRRAFRGALRGVFAREPAGDDLESVLGPALAATRAVAEAKIRAYASPAP